MSKGNLSAVLKSKNDLRLEDTPIPVPEDDEVLIAIHSVGICGSDVHYWVNGRIGDFVVENPMILGHESSGTVVKIGKNVKNLKNGDRVAIEPGVPCRYCDHCKSGRYNLCESVKFCATPPFDGTLCRYYKHAADFCYKLPDHVSFEEGALLEPLSVAVHACRRSGVTAGSSVLICGAGPIGLMHVLTARAMGARNICVTDICENRLQLAKNLGANSTLSVLNSDVAATVDKVKSLLKKSPDITFECSGNEFSVELAIKVTKSGGTLLLIGMGKPQVTVPLISAAIREIDIRGVFRYANCYPIALDLVASGAVDVKPMITHRFPLEDSLKAFETSRTAAGGAIKVIIQCEEK